MTDMEKKIMVRLCAEILTETDLYHTDMEVQNLIDWICEMCIRDRLKRVLTMWRRI